MSSSDIAAIMHNASELEGVREQLEEILVEINTIHEKLKNTPEVVEKLGDSSLSRVRMLYMLGKELSEREAEVSYQLVKQLDAFLDSIVGREQWMTEEDVELEAFMKANLDYLKSSSPSMQSDPDSPASLKGEQVAAKVGVDDNQSEMWFVVRVINFDEATQEFEVQDEVPGDNDERTWPRIYKLPKSDIIPLPKSTDFPNIHNFPPECRVLAVYPETTALYKATMIRIHKQKRVVHFVLTFDGDEEVDGCLPLRSVPFYWVVPLPKECQEKKKEEEEKGKAAAR
ncbi:SAGA-associated factor 29 homolog A-like [Andrographis paniculata]|uniref:SAGA-associated factor 29 homolog A-like n=1 Tax=Andrographis paniculata TaxID=175694 RepID=UPI0021E8DA96|nr:SAGA-associated factor 29 homolog A-like [Andrographis paniculata]